jgi:hypothetical protein
MNKHLEQVPEADAISVLVPGPVRHVWLGWVAGGRADHRAWHLQGNATRPETGSSARADARAARVRMPPAAEGGIAPLPGLAGPRLSPPRPQRPRHRLRPYLNLPKENQHLHRPGWTAARDQEVDEGIWLVTCSRIGTENLATRRQPMGAQVVTYVLGTFCHPCLRAGQYCRWLRG